MQSSINLLSDRRLEALLNDAEKSGDYAEVTRDEFDTMEREALTLTRRKAEEADL